MFRIVCAGAAAALALMAPAALADETLSSGSFTGVSGHTVSGGIEIVKTAEGYKIVLGEDFSFDGAPDARVGFGRGGKFVAGTDFAALRRNAGAQSYDAPSSLDPAEYDEVYIWCGQFSVPLGKAKLN